MSGQRKERLHCGKCPSYLKRIRRQIAEATKGCLIGVRRPRGLKAFNADPLFGPCLHPFISEFPRVAASAERPIIRSLLQPHLSCFPIDSLFSPLTRNFSMWPRGSSSPQLRYQLLIDCLTQTPSHITHQLTLHLHPAPSLFNMPAPLCHLDGISLLSRRGFLSSPFDFWQASTDSTLLFLLCWLFRFDILFWCML